MSFSLSLLIVLAAAYAAQVDGQTTPLPVNCRESVQIPKGRYVDITSPNYPENYPYNADCEWIISTENNTKIYVEHFDFFTEADFDFYSAGNGKTPSQNSSVIWQFSGSFPPEDFMSTDITVWITFTSDHIISYRGFHTRVHDTGLSSCSNLCGLDNPAQGCNCEKTCVLTETCCSDYFEVCAGDCNEVVTVPEGGQVTITSPNYPENYPDDALCQWIVSSERRSIMQVRFTEFYTQPGKDFFFAGNGDDPSEENSVIWMHSGFVAPPDFLSSDSTVWMRFSSDYAGTEKGFHVEVEDMYGKGSCLDACDTFDTQFQCSCQRDCVFDANCCPDYFELCAGNCIETLYVNAEEKIDVYSPNYPANYPNNARCEYIIYSNGSTSQLLVDFVDFSTELNYDHFFAGYGDQPNVNATTEIWAHSGSSLPPSYSTSYESVWFRLFTDSSGTDRGFHATVESLGATCHGMCGTFNSAFQCSCYNDCGYDGNCCPDFAEACGTEGCVEDFILEEGGSVIITSPNYPGTYPNNALCRWTVNAPEGTVLSVTFQDFELEGCCDYFSTGNGLQPSEQTSVVWRLSGTTAPDDFMADNRTLWVTFTSDFSIVYRGFHMTVTDLVCGDTLTVPTGGKITVTSPNYPDDYPDNMDCVWYISSESGNAILAEYQSFNLEECCDFYSAGNGAVPGEASSLIWQHSGTLLPADFTSTGPSIWMTMTSDASVSARGFRVILTDTGVKG